MRVDHVVALTGAGQMPQKRAGERIRLKPHPHRRNVQVARVLP